MIQTLVIFGASGDLTSRFLMPAIVRLQEVGVLPEGFRILGIAQDDWTTEQFRSHLEQKSAFMDAGPAHVREEMLSRSDYRRADVTNHDQLARALGGVTGPLVAYLALPPSLFAPSIESLVALKLPKGSKVVVEKPFGESLESAQALNRLLHESFPERDVFRLDHFLGKQTVQNILGLRFANRLFEPVWNTHHIERVEIIWDETLTAAGRASFYDATGALRDMIQNHLLQLLALVAMEPLHALDERSFRDHKVAVLRAVRRLEPDEVVRQTMRGRYGRGRIGTNEIVPYVEEPGVRAERRTETFAQVTLAIDNWRWAGVPFVLRTGKALGQDRREIAIHFKPVPHLAFGQEAQPEQNVLKIELSPDRIALAVNVNKPGDLCQLDRIELDTSLFSEG
ncbi:MAG: glucose-6-phosphate dehydrogenase, partial [Nitrospira sp.]|nr:glucose-6-phosphate dehydrogenase [Nitrospira sp.]